MSTAQSTNTLTTISTRFHQQKIEAWKPEFSMSSLFPGLFICGMVFILIGGGLLGASKVISDISMDYSECTNIFSQPCYKVIKQNSSNDCYCYISFNISNAIKKPVYLYYQMDNFYQNHRHYLPSRDVDQLHGDAVDYKTISDKCEPIRREHLNGSYQIYAPCGLVANSIFNDSFQLVYNKVITINMTKDNIAWDIDRNLLYGKPKTFNNTIKPPNWAKSAYERDPNSYKDEELMVWMRSATLPNFKKLHRVLDLPNVDPFYDTLPAGQYVMGIKYNYPVMEFSGRKSFVLSNTNFLGGKNEFMGAAFLSVGCIQFLLAIIFIVIPYLFHKSRDIQSNDVKLRFLKPSFSDVPLITSQSTPNAYGITENNE